MRSWLWMMFVMVACTGCVPIPVPIGLFTEAPYAPDVLEKLEKDSADKATVRRLLGRPQGMRSQGSYWFYGSVRESLGFIGADLVLEDYEWLMIHFDARGQVDFLELNHDAEGCLSNGICNYSNQLYSKPELAVLSAPEREDTGARSYQVAENECAVYLFQAPLSWAWLAGPVVFSVDGEPMGVLNHDTFLFFTHPLGNMDIAAYLLSASIPCREAETIYIKAVESWRSYPSGVDLLQTDAAEGEAAIRLRKLALPY